MKLHDILPIQSAGVLPLAIILLTTDTAAWYEIMIVTVLSINCLYGIGYYIFQKKVYKN